MMTTATARNFRSGAYGDPAFVPFDVWHELYGESTEGTGYTHQWRTCDQRLSAYLMASVQSQAEVAEAVAMGWRTYRVDLEAIGPLINEVICPEESAGIQCDDCRLCGGTRKPAKNIVITPITKGDGPAVCYVNTGWLGMWKTWFAGNVPAITPAILGDYMAGRLPHARYETVEAWRGPSPVDGTPIVLILTGLSPLASKQSTNRKTGAMVQSYILRQDMAPIVAVMSAMDRAVCGDCPLRPATATQA
tara:strand:+ start:7449 stop:8192 length:744 start_codon:yes stop_codon:yes gene_type:complete